MALQSATAQCAVSMCALAQHDSNSRARTANTFEFCAHVISVGVRQPHSAHIPLPESSGGSGEDRHMPRCTCYHDVQQSALWAIRLVSASQAVQLQSRTFIATMDVPQKKKGDISRQVERTAARVPVSVGTCG